MTEAIGAMESRDGEGDLVSGEFVRRRVCGG